MGFEKSLLNVFGELILDRVSLSIVIFAGLYKEQFSQKTLKKNFQMPKKDIENSIKKLENLQILTRGASRNSFKLAELGQIILENFYQINQEGGYKNKKEFVRFDFNINDKQIKCEEIFASARNSVDANIKTTNLSNRWGKFLKLVEDWALGLLLLFFSAPIIVFVSLAIKLESTGPVFIRHKRYGLNNREFWSLKFRTIVFGPPSEKDVPQIGHGYPQVTKVGRFLRLTSLDELPQLFNVFNGTMSIVGPRPFSVKRNEMYFKYVDKGYFNRHRVKPGIVGWSQANNLCGEAETPELMRARVKSDFYYIENWSLFFDFQILFRGVSSWRRRLFS